MGISHYLAMTAEEIAAADSLPEKLAYMACHFSLYGTGITCTPETLPKKAMLILNDRIPFRSHDPRQIAMELAQAMEALHCDCLLLDFQRQDTPKDLGKALSDALPRPMGISEGFGDGTQCAVFLPPVPPDKALEEYLKPWAGREIWLEAEPETIRITVDTQESSRQYSPEDEGPFPCVIGKGILVFLSHLKRRKSQIKTRE